MTQQMIDTNKTVNEFLQQSYALEQELEKRGYRTLASQVRRTSSVVSHWVITITGLDEELRKFWDEKKQEAANYN